MHSEHDFRAMAQKLYRTAKELIEGYELIVNGYKTRRLYLIGKALPSGNVSLIKYGRNNGRRFRVSTGVILECETSPAIKRKNEEKIRLKRVECDSENADLERKDAGFQPVSKDTTNFIDFIMSVAQAELSRTGNKRSYFYCLKSLAAHVEVYSGANTRLKDITLDWVQGFLDYLKNDALNFNYLRASDKGKQKKIRISQNSQCRLQRNLSYALNKAAKAKKIPFNPMSGLDRQEKVKQVSGTRFFLTEDEIKKLKETPYTHGIHDIKPAFLFSCYTGIRYSDLQAIKKRHFHKDKNGTYLEIIMQKTKSPLKVYVPQVAMNLVQNVQDDDVPVFSLPKNDNANKSLKKWLEDAGITDRKITFHSGRHSAATLLLSNNIPLAVVGKQLGQKKSSTTEIYAKLVDDAQKGAASKMDDLFNDMPSPPKESNDE